MCLDPLLYQTLIISRVGVSVILNLADGFVRLMEQEDGMALVLTQPQGVHNRSGARVLVVRPVSRLHVAESVGKPTPTAKRGGSTYTPMKRQLASKPSMHRWNSSTTAREGNSTGRKPLTPGAWKWSTSRRWGVHESPDRRRQASRE